MDEEYKQSDISKEVERLMDEEGFTFGEAVKQAMAEGYKDGGLMIAIQRFAQGGGVGSLMQPRVNFKGGGMDMGNKSNQAKSASMGSSKSSSTNKGPAGGASSGGNYGGNKNPNQTYGGGGGGNNNNNTTTKTKPNPGSGKVTKVKRVAKPSFLDKFNKHRIATQIMKNKMVSGAPTYTHRLGGLNFKQNFPNMSDTTAGILGYGYQGITEAAKALGKPTSTNIFGLSKNLFDAGKKAISEGSKNLEGFKGQGIPETSLNQYNEFMSNLGLADGGGVGSLMQPKRQGLFMGGSPLTGEALAIYNSMNSYGYTDQDIADKLLSLNLYTPPGTTPPPGTPPPGTPPPGGNNGGNGGGDGGAGTTITKKTRNKLIDEGIAAANADKGSLTLEEITAMNDLSGQESMRGQITPKTTLEKIISSNKPNMLDIAGNSLPVNFDSEILNNPNLDPRVPSIEAGSAGFAKPNMRDVAEEELVNTSDSNIMESLISGSDITNRNRGQTISPQVQEVLSAMSRPTMADVANDLEKGPVTMENIGAPDIPSDYDNFGQFGFGNFAEFGPQTIGDLSNIGMAKDPEGVEDPYGGKYTPSFEEKKAAEGILAGLFDNIKSYNPLQLDNILTSLSAKGLVNLAKINSPYAPFAAGLGLKQIRKKVAQKEIEKQAAATKTRKETREIQDRLDKQETTINKNASNNDSKSGASTVNPNSAYGKKQGYTGGNPNPHTDTGWSGSSKSNKSNKSSGTKSGGAGKGGGADSGKSGGSKSGGSKNSSQQGGGFNSYGFSDIRLKDNIELVGKSHSDINIYNFTYLNDPTVYQGVMAHEVPWASVKHDNGYLMVDYNKVDVDFKIIN